MTVKQHVLVIGDRPADTAAAEDFYIISCGARCTGQRTVRRQLAAQRIVIPNTFPHSQMSSPRRQRKPFRTGRLIHVAPALYINAGHHDGYMIDESFRKPIQLSGEL